MKKLKKTAVFLSSLFLLCTATSCGEMEIEKKNVSIEVITLSKGIEFWETVNSGAKSAGAELGIDIICEAPSDETDVEGQIKIIENAISQNVDAIVIAPIDASKLTDSLRKAHEKGIKIITIYSPAEYTEVSSLISANNIDAGEIGARNMAQLIGGKGDVAIVCVQDNNITSRIERKQGFRSLLDSSYPDIQVIAEQICYNSVEDAKNKTIQCIKSNPQLKGIYSTNQSVTEGVCEAIKQLETSGEIEQDQIKIVGWNASSVEVSYIEQGILDGTLVQNPYLYGYLGVRNAWKVCNPDSNKIIDSYINAGINYVNSENLNEDNIQILIHPES